VAGVRTELVSLQFILTVKTVSHQRASATAPTSHLFYCTTIPL